jgi:gliding motility-associated-like protein
MEKRPLPRISQYHKARTLALWCLLLIQVVANAQGGVLLPTRGKRFWTGFMQNGFGAQQLRVHIVGTTATSGTVSMPLTGWSTNFTVAANGVAVISVPTGAENWGSENVYNKGVLVESADSVNVFISSFQNFTHDLAQVLPENSLGNSYRVDGYHGLPNFNNLHKSELLIVSTVDGTEVSITPSVPTLGGRPAGVPFTVELNAGQTYQVQAAQDVLDLTGTLVEATANSGSCRPFVVMGGSMCATAPGACSACDVIFEQMVPRSAWGTRYFTVPITGASSSTYRIMADENNTSVTIGGGAPINLNAGQRHEVNGSSTPVCIQANKPVSVVQIMEGYSCAGNGDPSLLLLSPDDRLSTKALFHTPTSPQINQHSISLVVPNASIGQLTLNGNPVTPGLFQAYPGCSDRSYASLNVPAGVNRVQAANGFQLHIFGMGFGESYASMAHDIGAPPVQQDSLICGGGPVTLNAPEPMANAVWTTGSNPNTVIGTGNSLTVTPTASESYTITGEQPSSGCPQSFTFNVGIPLTIPIPLTVDGAPSASICQYASVQLALDPAPDPAWFNIQWSPEASLSDPNIANPVASPMTDTWYVVQVSSPSGCGNMVDSILVQVTPSAVLDLEVLADPPELCTGNSTELSSRAKRVVGHDQFNAAPGALWTAIQGGAISNACGSVSGTALYFNGSGQRYAQTVGLNVANAGEVRFHLKIADGVAPCANADPGEDVVLEYSTNNGISWNLLQTFLENGYPVFTPIEVVLPNPALTANTMFRLRQLAHTGAGHDNWAVDEFLVVVEDNNWLSYQWIPGSVIAPNASTTMATPATSGWYLLQGTDPTAGCQYADSVYVLVEPAFGVTVNNDTTLCAVAGIQLAAQANTTADLQWTWSPDNGTLSAANIPNPVATPQQTTTYTVTATSGSGCSASAQTTVTVGQLLDLVLSTASDTLCQGQSTTLNASGSGASNLSYSWNNASTLSNPSSPQPVATPTQTTTYTCTVTDIPSGCSLTASITIVVNTGYTANAGADQTLCSTLGYQLGVQHNVPNPTYQWSPAANLNASNIQAPSILVDGTATYTVTVSDANGCSVSDEVVISKALDGLPTQLPATACANTPPTLTAPATGVSYSWNTGATTPSIVPANSGPHTVTITDAQGCQGITTFDVTLFPLPVVALGPDVSLCGAASHVLDAGNPGAGHSWTTGASTQQITVTSSGQYGVTVTNANGCSAAGQINVQFNPLPVNNLQNVTACASDPPTLDAGNAGSSYAWSTGATTQTIDAIAGGTYSVAITTPQGCNATFAAEVVIMPLVFVELGNDTSICAGGSMVLDTGNPGASHTWSNGASGQSITISQAGTYGVLVSNGWCSASDEITLGILPLPTNHLADVTVCADQAVVLDAGNAGSDHLWNTGSTTQSIDVTESGSYSVLVTNGFGCSNTFSATVALIAPPVVDLGGDRVLCEGEVLSLDGGNPGSNHSWNTGASTQSIAVTQTGNYSVVVNNGYCQREDAVLVLFNPVPLRPSQRLVHVCLDEEPRYAILNAENPGSEYAWSTGQTSQAIQVDRYGPYEVSITNMFGCSLTDVLEVEEYCPSTIYVPNTFTPDGDGINDIFIPVGKNIASMELIIFDRWGGVLFQSNSPDMGWDGTYRGQPVKNDVYVWKVRYRFQEDANGRLGMEKEQMGHIQVLR